VAYLITSRFSHQTSEPGILVTGLSSPSRGFAIGLTADIPEDSFTVLGPVIIEELYGDGMSIALIYLALARVVHQKKAL